MTQDETASHLQQRSLAELEAAELLFKKGNTRHRGAVLFHCHLALELALKAEYIRQHDTSAPFSHDINELAHAVRKGWNTQEKISFEKITEFAVLARYGDEEWFEKNAPENQAGEWLKKTKEFITTIQS